MKMSLIGICLVVAAIAGLLVAKPRRGGVVKMSRYPFMQVATALGITVTGVLGLVMIFIGLGRFSPS